MRSDRIKKGFERAPHRALLKATGVTDSDMGKPFVAVCNSYIDIIPGTAQDSAVPPSTPASPATRRPVPRSSTWTMP